MYTCTGIHTVCAKCLFISCCISYLHTTVTETLMPKVRKSLHTESSPSVKLLQVQGSQSGGRGSKEQYSKMTPGPQLWEDLRAGSQGTNPSLTFIVLLCVELQVSSSPYLRFSICKVTRIKRTRSPPSIPN